MNLKQTFAISFLLSIITPPPLNSADYINQETDTKSDQRAVRIVENQPNKSFDFIIDDELVGSLSKSGLAVSGPVKGKVFLHNEHSIPHPEKGVSHEN